jgi:predicted amidohydrolase
MAFKQKLFSWANEVEGLKEEDPKLQILERKFSDKPGLTLGLANIHANVPDIEGNKNKIAKAARIFKQKGVNVAIFPEFCLAGYFWEDQKTCWPYMEQAIIEKHMDWVKGTLEGMLDNQFKMIIFNNIRRGWSKNKKFLNSTYMVNRSFDYMDDQYIYDKTMLPGIENTYTQSGKDDYVVVDTQWGKFGVSTCYDMCFSQLYQEYARNDGVDAVIEIASWRGPNDRDYPGMNVNTHNYYGYIWDLFAASRSASYQMWLLGCNAVGEHPISHARFWGGSGIWTPAGMKLVQASHQEDELLIVHNLDIVGEKKKERDEFDYGIDFRDIYKKIEGKRAFTRL